MEIKESLKHILGRYKDKEALQTIREQCDLLKDTEDPIKGVIITGYDHVGKTTFLKAFIDSFDCEKINLYTKDGITVEHIKDVFSKAKDMDRVVIYLDDMDLRLSEAALGTLLNKLMVSKGNVIFVATSKNLYKDHRLYKYIYNHRTFARHLHLTRFDFDQSMLLISNLFKKCHLRYSQVELYQWVIKYASYGYLSDLQAFLEAYSIKGDKLTIKDINPSNNFDLYQIKDDKYYGKVSYQTCVSEAGHILMACQHLENSQFVRCGFINENECINEIYHYQECVPENVKKDFSYPHLQIVKIKIAMAGYLNELANFKSFDGRLILKHKRVINDCLDEIVRNCYINPIYNNEVKHIEINRVSYSNQDNDNVTKIKEKLFRQYERETKKWVKQNKDTLKKIADKLYNLKSIELRDIPYLKADNQE